MPAPRARRAPPRSRQQSGVLPGVATAAIESKTNFFRPLRSGMVEAIARPLHVGRTTIVVQTDLMGDRGKRLAQTTQTHTVLCG